MNLKERIADCMLKLKVIKQMQTLYLYHIAVALATIADKMEAKCQQ